MGDDDETEPIAARVPKELVERIRAMAARGDRTIGRQIARLLRLGAAAEEAEQARGQS